MIIALRTLAAAIVAVTLSLAFGETDKKSPLSASTETACQSIACN